MMILTEFLESGSLDHFLKVVFVYFFVCCAFRHFRLLGLGLKKYLSEQTKEYFKFNVFVCNESLPRTLHYSFVSQ